MSESIKSANDKPPQVRLYLPHGTVIRIVNFLPIKDHPNEEGAGLLPVDLVWERRGRLGKRRAKYFLQRWVIAALCAGASSSDTSINFARRIRREHSFVSKYVRAEAATIESIAAAAQIAS